MSSSYEVNGKHAIVAGAGSGINLDFTQMLPDRGCSVMMSAFTEQPQYGDGNIVEAMLVGTRENPFFNIWEAPLEALYPTTGPLGEDNHLLEEEEMLTQQLKKHGMR